jgi:hypothetical protein
MTMPVSFSRLFTAQAAALVLVLLCAQPAHAVTCSTVSPSCEKGSSAAAKAATSSMQAEFSTLVYWVEYYMEMVVDRVTRMGNSESQNSQVKMNGQANQVDTQNVPTATTKIAEGRIPDVKAFVPSATTCAAVTRNFELSDKEFSATMKARYDASQAASTNFASNDPAGPSGKGAVASAKFMFDSTLKDFCDSTVLTPPGGVPCTIVNDTAGEPMAFRFALPFKAIFSRERIPTTATDPENRAARLFAQLAIEPVPPDPIRNAALTRSEGKNLLLTRYSDVAAVNLARGVLDRMIDDRLATSAAGDKSLQQIRQEAWASSKRAYDEAVARAKNGTTTNARDIAPLILDQNRIYMQIYLNLERLAAIKSAHLARSIKQNAASGGSSSGSAMTRQ